ncbi:MAG: monovalent cation/H+ antiporter complex subunit F [Bacillota bacterium]
MNSLFMAAAVALMIPLFACLYRAVIGPTATDRVISINVIASKTVAIIALISFGSKETFFLDVAVVYALIGFVITIGVAKYLEYDDIG